MLENVVKRSEFGYTREITLYKSNHQLEKKTGWQIIIIIIIIDNFCIALFSGVPKLTALYNILQHILSFTNIIHIIMTTNNV